MTELQAAEALLKFDETINLMNYQLTWFIFGLRIVGLLFCGWVAYWFFKTFILGIVKSWKFDM